ncbi:hypothetical protein PLESTM_000600700 [Pleodorina starrii]|nr:hypothetical protein PLESTM_000600700 [Pleodorina starrii]
MAIEIIPGLYYFLTVKRADSLRYSPIAQSNICYCIDDELLYEPFFADFGPLNLGRTYRFCQKTKQLLQEAERTGKRVYLYTGPHAHQKANAAVLVGIYQVIFLNRTADVAYKPLSVYKPFVPFRDASCGVSTFHLTVYDVIRGIQRARDVGFIDWNSGSSTWSLEEYEYYEQVENGDLNWIVPGKFVAFSGPAARSNEIAGYRLHTPEDYWDYFRRKGVTTVVRLNKKVYDRKRFLDGGFKHHEMYFPDGSCPTEPIIQRFLDTVEAEPGAIAVHCKAGLGRTGLLICLYIMKHYRFTAEEVIGYIRVSRPGSVIGPQQNFLREVGPKLLQVQAWPERRPTVAFASPAAAFSPRVPSAAPPPPSARAQPATRPLPYNPYSPYASHSVIAARRLHSQLMHRSPYYPSMEARMWHEGELYRAARGMPKAGPAASDLVIAGRAAGMSELAASPNPLAIADAGIAAAAAANGRNGYHGSSASSYSQLRASNSGGVAARAAASGVGVSVAVAAAGGYGGAAASPAAAADMSLLQYSKHQQYGAAAGQYGSTAGTSAAAGAYLSSEYGGSISSPAVLSGGVGSSAAAVAAATSAVQSYGAVSSFRSRYNAGGTGYGSSTGAGGVGRSMTPLRYGQQGANMGGYHHVGVGAGVNHHHNGAGHYGGMHHSSSHPGPLQSAAGGATRGSIGISAVARSITVPPGGAAAGHRSPSTGRLSVAAGLAAPPTSSAVAGLWSTLHTETLAAADRPKLIPERNTQSADVGSGFGLGGTSLSPSGVAVAGGASASPWRIAVPGAGSSAGSSGPGTPNSAGSAGGGAGSGGGAAGVLNRAPSYTNRNVAAGPVGAAGSTSGGVARILAPNGQPRKVPVALLNQYTVQQQQQSAAQHSGGGWAAGGMGPKPPSGVAPAQMRTSYSYGIRQ